jgi:hypothetical protein
LTDYFGLINLVGVAGVDKSTDRVWLGEYLLLRSALLLLLFFYNSLFEIVDDYYIDFV